MRHHEGQGRQAFGKDTQIEVPNYVCGHMTQLTSFTLTVFKQQQPQSSIKVKHDVGRKIDLKQTVEN